MTEERPLLTFPCDFTFKVIGLASAEFEGEVLKIFRQHFPQLGEGAIRLNHSKNDKYVALSITVFASSQEQLDETYRSLSNEPQVLFAL